jgi:hypothetical protein
LNANADRDDLLTGVASRLLGYMYQSGGCQ